METEELFGNKTESAGHKIGKRISKVLLKMQRFYNSEIKEEYPVILPDGKIRRIDVAGISLMLGKKIAYEVGDLNGGGTNELYVMFNEVKNPPKINIDEENINKSINFFEEEINLLNDLIQENYSWLNEDYKIDSTIKQILINRELSSYRPLLDDDYELDVDKLEEYINDEIDFVYKTSKLSKKNFLIIQKRLFGCFFNNYFST